MFKTGICDCKGTARRRSLLGRPRPLSLGLLRTSVPAAPPAVGLFEEIMLELQLSNGTCRTTCRDRFSEMNGGIDALLSSRFGAASPLVVHDWATSDSSAAAEWARGLRTRFPRLQFVASDQTLYLVEAFRRPGESYFFEPDGAALQYAAVPFVVPLSQPESPFYPVNRWIARRALRTARLLRDVVAQLRWTSMPDATVLTSGTWKFRQIPLIHPEVQAFARERRWFRLQAHSVFDALADPAHVIRSMNIFNLVYFTAAELERGAAAVYASLHYGGLWIVGRSTGGPDNRTDATVFEKAEQGFRAVMHVGQGSEIQELVGRCQPGIQA